MRYQIDRRIGTTLTDIVTGKSVYFQPGDDEAAFETHYEPLADAAGSAFAAAEMWQAYGHLAA